VETMNNSILWDIMPCSLASSAHSLHHDDFLHGLFFSHEEGGLCSPEMLTFTGIHGIISWKTEVV
jgi:hypothetical protein